MKYILLRNIQNLILLKQLTSYLHFNIILNTIIQLSIAKFYLKFSLLETGNNKRGQNLK